MIFKGSRYAKLGTYQVTHAGRVVEVLKIRFLPDTPAGYQHAFMEGERLDLLAYRFYRNPEKFWLIADANGEMDPAELVSPGRQLAIPPDRPD